MRGPTTSPPNATILIQQINIPNLGIHHPNGLLYGICQTLPHQEIPLVLLWSAALPHPPHEHPNQPRFERILLYVDIDLLSHRRTSTSLEDLVEPRILRLPGERRNLGLGPCARENIDDGDAAAEEAGCVQRLLGRRQGDAVHVGEVEGFVAFEKTEVRQESFTLVVAHVGPFSEVGFCDLSCPMAPC